MPKTTPMHLVILLLLTSCGQSGRDNSDFCTEAGPIYASKQDVISGSTARQIDSYNDYGQKKCGWMPSV